MAKAMKVVVVFMYFNVFVNGRAAYAVLMALLSPHTLLEELRFHGGA